MQSRLARSAAIAGFLGVAALADLSLSPVAAVATTPSMASSSPQANGPAVQERKGRYKKDGDNCVWHGDDSGPNQCTPQTQGRFKKGANDSCVWDSSDRGPDQCTPKNGRWKEDGGRCVWDPKDSGSNQCNPREPKR